MTTAEATLKRPESGNHPSHSWPGGYPLYYLTADSGVLCPDCSNCEEAKQAEADCPDDDQWRIIAADIHWEGSPITCDNCDRKIENAYGNTTTAIGGLKP